MHWRPFQGSLLTKRFDTNQLAMSSSGMMLSLICQVTSPAHNSPSTLRKRISTQGGIAQIHRAVTWFPSCLSNDLDIQKRVNWNISESAERYVYSSILIRIIVQYQGIGNESRKLGLPIAQTLQNKVLKLPHCLSDFPLCPKPKSGIAESFLIIPVRKRYRRLFL